MQIVPYLVVSHPREEDLQLGGLRFMESLILEKNENRNKCRYKKVLMLTNQHSIADVMTDI